VNALSYCVNREVKSFDSSISAWNYIESGNDIDIVISDVDMSGMSGFELLSRIKSKDPAKIVILMSDKVENEVRSRKINADAFLAKPFQVDDLFRIVQCFVVG